MKLGDEKSFVKIDLVDTESGHDMECDIVVVSLGFTGRDSHVWFEQDSLAQFIRDIERIREQKQGSAVLEDFSAPHSETDGFRLRVDSLENDSDVRVTADMRKPTFQSSKNVSVLRCQIAFEVNQETLLSAISRFKELLSDAQAKTVGGRQASRKSTWRERIARLTSASS